MKRVPLVCVLGVVFLTLLVRRAGAGEPSLPDPFSEQFRDPRSVAGTATTPNEELVTFKATADPSKVAPGGVFKLTITGVPRAEYHTYPLTIQTDKLKAVSKLTYGKDADLVPLSPVQETRPRLHTDSDLGGYFVHDREFTWTQDVLVRPEAKPGSHILKVKIEYMACDARHCVPASKSLEVPIEVTSAAPTPLSPELQKRLNTPEPPVEVIPLGAGGPKTPGPVERGGPKPEQKDTTPSTPTPTGDDKSDLLTLLLTSVGAAVAMLFTPCVFPMIPITVSFFLKQSEKKNHNAPLTAAVYSVTIIVVLALAVVLLGQLIVGWANSAWLNFALGTVLVVFALSLFGMYDIELPSFLTRWTSSGEGRGGYLGAVFMALTFTITSFTCTGPFLGPLLVTASTMRGIDFFGRLLAAVAYAATFAAPFFVLALFPGLLKRLPKSGGWLNSVKVVMGFLELAAALKFLGNVDLTLNPGRPWIFTYDTVLVSWIALSATCGLYLLGMIRLPHDTPQEHVGVPRMVLATIFFGLAVYMTPALWRETPTGVIGEGLVAFLPLDTRPHKAEYAGGGSAEGARPEQHFLDLQTAWDVARKEKKPLFIDFTAVNCTNCRWNENNVFSLPAVRQELAKYVAVQLYTDTVPDTSLKGDEPSARAQLNSRLQKNTYNDISLPLYVLLRPEGDKAIVGEGDEAKIAGVELGRHAGIIGDREKFLDMLRNAAAGVER